MQIKILVVDDSASDRLIIESMLDEYETLTAGNGRRPFAPLRNTTISTCLYSI